jgi:hypothetical protein
METAIGPIGASTQSGGNYTLATGSLVGFAATDCNADGRVDLLDLAAFETCMNGPAGGVSAGTCACLDASGDGEVDLADFSVIQNEFNGVP